MANHKSTLRRIRSDEKKKTRNKYDHKSTRTAIKNLRNSEDKKEAGEMLPKVSGMIDKLAKKNIIHKNKAANLKSGLSAHVKAL